MQACYVRYLTWLHLLVATPRSGEITPCATRVTRAAALRRPRWCPALRADLKKVGPSVSKIGLCSYLD